MKLDKITSTFLVFLLIFSFVFTISNVIADNEDNDNNQMNEDNGYQNGSNGNSDGNEEDENDNYDDSDNKSSFGLGQTIRRRVHAGTYTSENGTQIRVSEMAQNRLRINAGNYSADCDCNLTQEQIQNRTRFKMNLSNGRNAEIKVMPDVASETALQRLRLRVCNESNNCTLRLKEVYQNKQQNQSIAAYEMQLERHYRILGLFQAKAQNRIQIDAENGEIIHTQRPWWAFLASADDETEQENDE